MERKELEIMAPAGNFECLQAAIQGGADSVYFGIGRLNMRSHSANNFCPEDLPEIVRICREYGVRSYMTLNIILSDDRSALFGAFEDNLLIGTASVRMNAAIRWADITDLRVEAAHRRQGIGRNLLDFCERLALKRGMHGLRIACADTNPALCQFCEHCGFTLAGVDAKALAYTDSEREKPLARRAALLTFYKPIQKG